jgi:hypothetical protein
MTAAMLVIVRPVVSFPGEGPQNNRVTTSRGQRKTYRVTDSCAATGDHRVMIPHRCVWIFSYSRAPRDFSSSVVWSTSWSSHRRSTSYSESRTTGQERALTLQRLSA